MRVSLYLIALLLLVQPVSLASQKEVITDPAWESLAFSVEDSRCFVGLAPVYLSVSDLKPQDGKLIGTYSIKVPLMASKNDHGKIVLPLNATVSELGAKGGIIKGEAHSMMDEGIINTIVCEIIPKKDQTIKLAITTKDRTVNFMSRYSVIESTPDEQDNPS